MARLILKLPALGSVSMYDFVCDLPLMRFSLLKGSASIAAFVKVFDKEPFDISCILFKLPALGSVSMCVFVCDLHLMRFYVFKILPYRALLSAYEQHFLTKSLSKSSLNLLYAFE